MRHNLVCTVGTSLFTTLGRPNSAGAGTALSQAYSRENWIGLATALKGLDPADHLCGAEINSIDSMVKKACSLAGASYAPGLRHGGRAG